MKPTHYSKNHYEEFLAPQIFERQGFTYQPATFEQNIRDKYDFIVNDAHKVQVNGPKRPRGYVLFEATGISGFPGWCCGEADFVLQFMERDSAILYNRQAVLELAIELGGRIPYSDQVERPEGKEKKLRQWIGRPGNNRRGMRNEDVYMLLTLWDLQAINYETVKL